MSLLIKKILQKIKEFENKTQDSGWQNLTLLNNWQLYTSSQNIAQYRKKDGIVYLHGVIHSTEVTTVQNRNIAQLPTDCIPTGIRNNLYFPIHLSNKNTSTIQITTEGMIFGEINIPTGVWISLDGISFPVN